MAANANAVPQDTLITIKVSVNDSLKKLKLPLRDLGANTLPDKLRHALNIKPEQTVVFERFSDSAGGYITLDQSNPQVFKTLIRAAKAKLKLRLKATVSPIIEEPAVEATETSEEKPKHKAMEPVIVRSPTQQNGQRESTAMDGRSIGSGIFQFREARASQQTLVDVSEAPVPCAFTADNKDFFEELGKAGSRRGLVYRTRNAIAGANPTHPWSVYCNECDVAMDDVHFHCNICDGGDYDLCEDCVASGKLCSGDGHWLIKRFIKDGKVVSSTTERISPRKAKEEPEVEKGVPGAYTEETKTLAEPVIPTRTCNSCVIVLPEREFVTCTTCEDFDLCIQCHVKDKHGHHPAHGFEPATEETTLPLTAEMLLAPGRNTRHNAICDGCDKKILGVRYKCLNCPDWDYCTECHKNARHVHPHHRFAPLYEPIAEPRGINARHLGIYCDGPLCSNGSQRYIVGVRYKCAVCHDTDFCASCEAFPSNTHNRTHPLIKFKTPVRNVSITTENQDVHGQMRLMGDQPVQAETKTASTETTPVPQSNAATQVQTVAEIKPTELKAATQPVQVAKQEVKSAAQSTEPVPATLLNAHFVQDSISDGTAVLPGSRFTQMWTLRNPGPYAWPAGCSVRFVGGDNMLNVDNTRPAAVSDIANASESNVVGREVPVKEEISFKVTLKAPTREGKHISYWRMKSADGTPFGHRLWCDIEVKAAPAAPQVPAVETAVQAPDQPNVQLQQHMRMQQMTYQRQRQQMMMAQNMRSQALAQAQSQAQAQAKEKARQAEAQAQRTRMVALAHAQAQAGASGPPPSYDATYNAANITSRIAAMREQQAKRREHMMQQFTAGMNQSQSSKVPEQVSLKHDDEDKARKEAARQRVEHIKAKILRARQEKAVDTAKEEAVAAQAAEEKAAEEKKNADSIEKVKKIIEEVTKADQEKEEDLESSQMVFPKLDKESPASSTYQSVMSSKGKAAYVENEQGEIERSATPSVASPTPAPVVPSSEVGDDFDDLEDIEVLSANGEDSEDDGFDTDEEYDILDASDHETVASK
ncbi:uncharacterized protein LTR77_006707 [Saxophila tyrrhenica]|uniref:ZZ-type domain-containing protein n=1 Tax=Saxophila tyrrhenica TaxID=1690608 RepID=A0AAV9P602_9PEZI|nr:hypothetical protein LTR77_006707 [Saxophila tyrrhenica]